MNLRAFKPNVTTRLIPALMVCLLPPTFALAQTPEVEFVIVPASDEQIDGPVYDFRISQFEIRNDQFIKFLNDALENLDNERGYYMYFDVDSNDIYINNDLDGITGVDGSGTLMFDASANSAIRYEAGEPTSQYVLTDPNLASHPVTGVTWYGAVKYCNWLTIESGLPLDQRAYAEALGNTINGWRPVTIANGNWATRDLLQDEENSEREDLLDLLGFRLPMDNGLDEAAAYNEWYKAASARRLVDNSVVFDALYGFGRDAVTTSDANYFNSSDPFEPGTSPVGYFDGLNAATTDTANAYNLYDLSGNVWEWMQDQSPTDPTRRRNRGGSWESTTGSLLVASGEPRLADAGVSSTGFRVAQSVDTDLIVLPLVEHTASGIWGAELDDPSSTSQIYTLINITNEPVSFIVSSDQTWFTFDITTGTIDPASSIEITATISQACDDLLTVGENEAVITVNRTILDQPDELQAERSVIYTVREPLTLIPATPFNSTMTVTGSPSPANENYEFNSESDSTVNWSATWEEVDEYPTELPWLTIKGESSPTGTVLPNGGESISVAIDTLIAATLEEGVYTAEVTFKNDCTQTEFIRTVVLTVSAPFDVTPADEVTSTGIVGGPFDPEFFEFTLTNKVGHSVDWSISICIEEPDAATCTPPDPLLLWLEIDTPSGQTLQNETADITLTITPVAETLEADEHFLTLRFEDTAGDYFADRKVILDVTGLHAAPEDDVEFRGPLGGPFTPATVDYSLQNTGLSKLNWTAELQLDPLAPPQETIVWLEVSPASGVIIDPDGIDIVTANPSDEAALLIPGVYEGDIVFIPNGDAGAATTRHIILVVGGEGFSQTMVMIPGADVQLNGPDYDFRFGKFEITNRSFARFLNDATRNLIDPKGQYLYHNTTTGSVHINSSIDGEVGVGLPLGVSTVPDIYNAGRGRISYETDRFDPYIIEAGFENHPVTGVSWYGAAKYCNWLTLTQNMPVSQQVYIEAPADEPNPTIWTVRSGFDPSDSASNLVGFRLPMDDFATTNSPLNEWYKAASRKGVDENGDPAFGAQYGFGRDELNAADANYLNNLDTEENGTTPAGFFDGSKAMFGGSTTVDTSNVYRLYDLSGNVSEWVHEIDINIVSFGATRGGNFNLDAEFEELRTDKREDTSPEQTFSFMGFRIAQSLTPVPFRVSQSDTDYRIEGIVGGPYAFALPAQSTLTLQLFNDAIYTLDNMTISVSSGSDWLEFDGLPPSQLAPVTSAPLTLRLSDTVDDVSISPTPPSGLSFVSGRTLLTDGPIHDYWISKTEVTNAQFADFLNNALDDMRSHENDPDFDEPSPRSDYMYFDSDSHDVYINDARQATIGTVAPSETIITLLYDASMGRITYTASPTDNFEIEDGYAQHPVVGVTWLGALKYCNWLTINSNLPERARAYTEGTNSANWHPITVDDATWALRDLNDAERLNLIRHTIGYRLPMDDGGENFDPAIGEVDLYNEWFKAATYRIDDAGLEFFDALYGFGRNLLNGADANYDESGDTQLDKTTAVGFFNGTNKLFDSETETEKTDNGYDLSDISGNVAEWMQDQYITGDRFTRAVRGGSWVDPAGDALLNTTRSSQSPDLANRFTGFRVVRGTGHNASITMKDNISDTTFTRNATLDLREPLIVSTPFHQKFEGFFCEDFSQKTLTFTATNTSDTDIPWTVSRDQTWVTLTTPVQGELTGELLGGVSSQIEITATTNNSVNDLTPGDHAAKINLFDDKTNEFITRTINLTINPPATVTTTAIQIIPEPPPIILPDPLPDPLPELYYEGFWLGPFDNQFGQLVELGFSLAREATCDLDYTITTNADWLTLTPEELLTGTLPPLLETVDVTVDLDEDIAITKGPGEYIGNVIFTLINDQDENLPQPIKKEIKLNVKDPIEINPLPNQAVAERWDIGCSVDALENPVQTYDLTNHHTSAVIGARVTSSVNWISIDTPLVSILPTQTKTITFTINDNLPVDPGEYPIEIEVEDTLTEFTQTRVVIVEIGSSYCVTPLKNVETSGRVGGSVIPSTTIYTVRNENVDNPQTVTWTISTDQPWVKVQDQSLTEITLGDGESAGVMFVIDEANLPQNPVAPQQTFDGTVTFTATANGQTLATVERNFSLTLVHATVAHTESIIPATSLQPAGPDYPFIMGKYLATNAEYVIFLNNALAYPDDPRGEYLFFETDTGNVYINSLRIGQTGLDAGARTIPIFSPADSSQIEFVGGVYQIVPDAIDFSNYPATGVSWYGAIKYCNWLTLDQGMLPNQRCYSEDTAQTAGGWRPVTITAVDWLSRDLNDTERAELVKDYRGFRLPMDDGFNNQESFTDTADDYNEWYKAAAWKWDEALLGGIHTMYGFGRDILGPVDANYLESGDPSEPGATPIGYFDGSNTVTAGTSSDTENAYGLYDMTGNVHQWIQGQYSSFTTTERRALRGGSYNDPVDSLSLINQERPRFARPILTNAQVGFRVVRTLAPTVSSCMVGPGVPIPTGCETYDINGDNAIDLKDFSSTQLNFSP